VRSSAGLVSSGSEERSGERDRAIEICPEIVNNKCLYESHAIVLMASTFSRRASKQGWATAGEPRGRNPAGADVIP